MMTTEQKGGRGNSLLRSAGKATAAVLSGVVMALAFPPYDLGNIAWIALIPLLCLLWSGNIRKRTAFAYGWLYGMGWYCLSFSWIMQVGHVFGIPHWLFVAVAFAPLMALYSCLPGLWALLAATLLRPALQPVPETEGTLTERKLAMHCWAVADLLSTLRSAVGCAALWVCIEWLRAHGTLGFSWNSLGMALYNGLSFAQWAEFTGVTALSFIPVFTSVILWCATRRCVLHFKGIGKACRPWDFYGCIIILMLLFSGGLMLSSANSAQMLSRKKGVLELPVLAVQLNRDQKDRIASGPFEPYMYRAYLGATKSAFDSIQQETMQKAIAHPELAFTQKLPVWIVWPESALGCPLWLDADSGERLSDAYTREVFLSEENGGLPLVRRQVREMGGQDFVLFTGADEQMLETDAAGGRKPRGMYNSMVCFPDGFESILSVSKQHLMPFGEYIPLADSVEWIARSYTEITGTQVGDGIRPGKGTEPMTVPVPGTDEKVGVIPAVCYEDTVGDLLARFARKGPQVIVNVTNDAWFRNSSCGVQQARAAAFRCIELRRCMVRAANMGLTCAIAPNGAPIHQLLKADGTPHLAGYSYAVLPVDRNAGLTVYALFGDWAVVLCALTVLLLCVRAIIKRRRGNR